MPIGYKLFPGNTAEIIIFIECVKKWKAQLQIDEVNFVADRGMMSSANLEILENNNMNFVVACPLKKLSSENKGMILEDTGHHLEQIDDKNVSWIKELKLSTNRRLIVTYNSSRTKKIKLIEKD